MGSGIKANKFTHEKPIWIMATRLRCQCNVPSEKFVSIITCDGTLLTVLKKHTKPRKSNE